MRHIYFSLSDQSDPAIPHDSPALLSEPIGSSINRSAPEPHLLGTKTYHPPWACYPHSPHLPASPAPAAPARSHSPSRSFAIPHSRPYSTCAPRLLVGHDVSLGALRSSASVHRAMFPVLHRRQEKEVREELTLVHD